MDNIVEFPTRSVRGWAKIEHSLRLKFTQESKPIEMQDYIISRMKEFHGRLDMPISMPVSMSINVPLGLSAKSENALRETITMSVNKAFKHHVQKLHKKTDQLFLERLEFEIELYDLKHRVNLV